MTAVLKIVTAVDILAMACHQSDTNGQCFDSMSAVVQAKVKALRQPDTEWRHAKDAVHEASCPGGMPEPQEKASGNLREILNMCACMSAGFVILKPSNMKSFVLSSISLRQDSKGAEAGRSWQLGIDLLELMLDGQMRML